MCLLWWLGKESAKDGVAIPSKVLLILLDIRGSRSAHGHQAAGVRGNYAKAPVLDVPRTANSLLEDRADCGGEGCGSHGSHQSVLLRRR